MHACMQDEHIFMELPKLTMRDAQRYKVCALLLFEHVCLNCYYFGLVNYIWFHDVMLSK